MKSIIVALILMFAPLLMQAAEPAHGAANSQAAVHAEEAPVSPEAPVVTRLGPIPITNAMIYTWIIGALIFVVVKVGTSNLKIIPSGLQNVIEMAVEGLENLTKGLRPVASAALAAARPTPIAPPKPTRPTAMLPWSAFIAACASIILLFSLLT